jgi:hypothetical protein
MATSNLEDEIAAVAPYANTDPETGEYTGDVYADDEHVGSGQ